MNKRNVVFSLVAVCLGLATAHAKVVPLNISAEANATWCDVSGTGITNCSTFPSGTQKYNGVTFNIPTTNNAWFANTAANGGSGQVSITIPVNVANVRTVYTLINTFWGSTQSGLLSLTFQGSNGATFTYSPVGNTDVRDYNNGQFTMAIDCGLPNAAGKSATVSAFNNGKGQHLDMQIIELPTSFASQTLVSITVTDNGAPNVQRSFLAAVSVSTALP